MSKRNGKNQVKVGPESDPFMTPREAMKVLKLSRSGFYRKVSTGCIPGAVKLGTSWRIDTVKLWEALRGTEEE